MHSHSAAHLGGIVSVYESPEWSREFEGAFKAESTKSGNGVLEISGLGVVSVLNQLFKLT